MSGSSQISGRSDDTNMTPESSATKGVWIDWSQ